MIETNIQDADPISSLALTIEGAIQYPLRDILYLRSYIEQMTKAGDQHASSLGIVAETLRFNQVLRLIEQQAPLTGIQRRIDPPQSFESSLSSEVQGGSEFSQIVMCVVDAHGWVREMPISPTPQLRQESEFRNFALNVALGVQFGQEFGGEIKKALAAKDGKAEEVYVFGKEGRPKYECKFVRKTATEAWCWIRLLPPPPEDQEKIFRVLRHDIEGLVTMTITSLGIAERLVTGDQRLIERIQLIKEHINILWEMINMHLPEKDGPEIKPVQQAYLNRLISQQVSTVVKSARLSNPTAMEFIVNVRDFQRPVCIHLHVLGRAIWNLLLNATRYTAERPGIVAISLEAGYLKAIVRDYGPGIPDELMPKIGQESVSGSGSTGLGLQNVYKLIHGVKGNIECKTVTKGEETGTTFTIELPIFELHQ
jgi:signal transduction histidine kinase